MDVSWTATDPESRQYSPPEQSPDIADLTDHITALRSRGQGYLEVRLPGREFPLLTLGSQDDQTVIHLFDAAEKSSPLVGDGTAAADVAVEVPIMDDLAVFSGHYVVAVDRAWTLLRNFIQTRAPGELGQWREL
ncbi:hypothetical protein [Streptomyces sp. NPDC056628]|uniref:hypothetical protein n=1 Tax=Streptomyces sp. NPDC056628 TaxID=3345882 RepID=UPI0036B8786B